jgi:hypothetical protein
MDFLVPLFRQESFYSRFTLDLLKDLPKWSNQLNRPYEFFPCRSSMPSTHASYVPVRERHADFQHWYPGWHTQKPCSCLSFTSVAPPFFFCTTRYPDMIFSISRNSCPWPLTYFLVRILSHYIHEHDSMSSSCSMYYISKQKLDLQLLLPDINIKFKTRDRRISFTDTCTEYCYWFPCSMIYSNLL